VAGFDYIRAPGAIIKRSMQIARDEADCSGVPDALLGLALRLVHAGGDAGLPKLLRVGGEPAAAMARAIAGGASVLVDAQMVAFGIDRTRLKTARVLCTLGLGTVRAAAERAGETRSAAAVELWRPWLAGAVVAIGTAPTSLFRLLEGLQEGWPKPALIIGMPVGAVGAGEAKQALVDHAGDIPYVTLTGRAGGGALAAAAVNALADSRP
jgi:precorrin-8X/cobalt-precorrin-8 methylmutase